MTHTTQARMHVSLNVGDIDTSVAFYSALFDVPPTKQRADYAKFTLDHPGLVLSFNAASSGGRGKPARAAVPAALSHLGIQLADDAELEALRARMLKANLSIALDEPGVTCCYAVQNKFWVVDPDGNSWEFYSFLDDAEVHTEGTASSGDQIQSACCVPASTDAAAPAPATGAG